MEVLVRKKRWRGLLSKERREGWRDGGRRRGGKGSGYKGGKVDRVLKGLGGRG